MIGWARAVGTASAMGLCAGSDVGEAARVLIGPWWPWKRRAPCRVDQCLLARPRKNHVGGPWLTLTGRARLSRRRAWAGAGQSAPRILPELDRRAASLVHLAFSFFARFSLPQLGKRHRNSTHSTPLSKHFRPFPPSRTRKRTGKGRNRSPDPRFPRERRKTAGNGVGIG